MAASSAAPVPRVQAEPASATSAEHTKRPVRSAVIPPPLLDPLRLELLREHPLGKVQILAGFEQLALDVAQLGLERLDAGAGHLTPLSDPSRPRTEPRGEADVNRGVPRLARGGGKGGGASVHHAESGSEEEKWLHAARLTARCARGC